MLQMQGSNVTTFNLGKQKIQLHTWEHLLMYHHGKLRCVADARAPCAALHTWQAKPAVAHLQTAGYMSPKLYMTVVQMQGPNVAPFTLGKQNLLLHTLRQLEKNYFVDGQFFRLGRCSHDERLQQANATVIIVRGTQAGNGGNGIGLEKVSVVTDMLACI